MTAAKFKARHWLQHGHRWLLPFVLTVLLATTARAERLLTDVAPDGKTPPIALHATDTGSGPPLLLIHGLGCSSFTWRKIVPDLAKDHRVITLDLKGFGKSAKPDDGAYSAEDQAALVAKFIQKNALKNLTIIGHSFGGTVALRTALRKDMQGPAIIKRLVIISAPALPGSVARHLKLIELPAVPDAIAETLSPNAWARMLLANAVSGRMKVTDAAVEGYAAPYREKGAVAAFIATARSIVGEKGRRAMAARYQKLKTPSLLVWCNRDPIVPLRSGRKLRKTLPKSRLVIFRGCQHFPQEERPTDLVRKIRSFFARNPLINSKG